MFCGNCPTVYSHHVNHRKNRFFTAGSGMTTVCIEWWVYTFPQMVKGHQYASTVTDLAVVLPFCFHVDDKSNNLALIACRWESPAIRYFIHELWYQKITDKMKRLIWIWLFLVLKRLLFHSSTLKSLRVSFECTDKSFHNTSYMHLGIIRIIFILKLIREVKIWEI